MLQRKKTQIASLQRSDMCYLSIVQIVLPAPKGAPTEGVFVMTPSSCPSNAIETLIDRATPIFLLSLSLVAAVGSLLITVG